MHPYNVGHFGLKIIARHGKIQGTTDDVENNHIKTSLV